MIFFLSKLKNNWRLLLMDGSFLQKDDTRYNINMSEEFTSSLNTYLENLYTLWLTVPLKEKRKYLPPFKTHFQVPPYFKWGWDRKPWRGEGVRPLSDLNLYLHLIIVSRGVGSPPAWSWKFWFPPPQFSPPWVFENWVPPSGGFRHFDSN